MSAVAARCLLALCAVLSLNATLLSAIGFLSGAQVNPLIPALAFLAMCGAMAAAHVVLAPLRGDVALLHRLMAASSGAAPAQVEPRAAESVNLLSGLSRLRARMDSLEAVSKKARGEAQEAERLRASFLASMGHDLRGPLNAIIGFSELLVMEGMDAVVPAQRPSVEIIRRRAADLVVLLDQILEWAKLEAGQVQLESEPLALAPVIADAASEAMTRSGERGLYVQCSVAEDLPAVRADRARLVQALLGLLDHGTRVPDRPRVTLSAWLARDERSKLSVRIEVRDPSLCIRASDHQSFFEALRPSYAPSGKRVAGLGLGPALARALIRAHGGEVWFSSEVDTGTRFVVELPTSMG